jgi:4a-hydroxytetrahydrobiopterin dehydratase
MDLKDISTLKEKYAVDWDLTHNSTRLNKVLSFKNFKQPFSLMMKIGNLAEEVKHHPDFKLGWGYLEIEITTHSVQGLTQADFELASKINHILSDK